MAALASLAHHQDDLLRPRRVGRVLHPLVVRRATGKIARHRRRRPPPARRVSEHHRLLHHRELPSGLAPRPIREHSAHPRAALERPLLLSDRKIPEQNPSEHPDGHVRQPVLRACGSLADPLGPADGAPLVARRAGQRQLSAWDRLSSFCGFAADGRAIALPWPTRARVNAPPDDESCRACQAFSGAPGINTASAPDAMGDLQSATCSRSATGSSVRAPMPSFA
jgi:hypothetical protein